MLSHIIQKQHTDKNDIVAMLSARDPKDVELLRAAAHAIMLDNCGNKVFYRGLVEFSNICSNDCLYCGIRKSNYAVKRYMLTKDEILQSAQFCADQGYGSIVLQAGERQDEQFIDFVTDVVKNIKQKTVSGLLPKGLGITLCIGEQTRETYERLFAAGAHRYLLRIETTSHKIYRQIHPETQQLDKRVECLEILKDIGYLVGTGVMIGLPNQTVEDLADDILFFKNMRVDMIGMGPYIVHKDTPMNIYTQEIELRKNDIFALSLAMIAATRIALRSVNIASTTALQAMTPDGREQGLLFGANIIMPQVTPKHVRHDYQLYEGKPCMDETSEMCRHCLENRILSVGREVGYGEWGDRKK